MLLLLLWQRITPLYPGLKRLGTARMLLSLDSHFCVLPVPNKVLHPPPLFRYPDSGADLPGQRPVCQAGAGGGSSRRGSHGDRDPEFHHQGTPRCWVLHSRHGCRSSRREPGPDPPAAAGRLRLSACPSPLGVSMTAATACPVSRQLGQEHQGSCLCKQARGESWLITQPPGSEGRCWDGLLLPALPVCLERLT